MGDLTIGLLIAKMADETTRWEALREVEKLADTTAIPPLVERISAERDERIRADLHSMLGHIGRNTGDPRVAHALVARLAAETDTYALAGILEALERQPRVPDCAAIIALTRDPRWLVRHAAILALGSCPSAAAEEALLAVLDTSEEVHDLSYANAALGKIGSSRAFPALARVAGHGPAEDVKTSALAALTRIGDASLVPVFLSALTDRNAHVRRYALTGLAQHGDERAIDPVIARVTQLLSRVRKQYVIPSEVVTALEFLLPYAATEARIPALFHMIRARRMDRLFPEERRWVEEHLP